MKSIETLDVMDIYRISFITNRGWKTNNGSVWTKPGVKQRAYATSGFGPCNGDTEEFTFEEAYYEELDDGNG